MCLCSYGECIAKDGRRVYSLLELANSDKALKNEVSLGKRASLSAPAAGVRAGGMDGQLFSLARAEAFCLLFLSLCSPKGPK